MILICGPCVIESEEQVYESADKINKILKSYNDIDFYFKASCVKDNRTSNSNFYGVGFEQGIKYLLEIKSKYDMKITTDFHTVDQIKQYGKFVDLVQIPAFLSMQTSLTNVAVELNKPIHIKKPQFLSPENTGKPVNKIKDQNSDIKVFITDRGTCFGYDEVIIDSRHVRKIKESCKADKVLVDITHPQNHSKIYDKTYSYDLGMAAIATGADGLFIESHPTPNHALCDGDAQLDMVRLQLYLHDFYNMFRMRNNFEI